MMCVQQRFHGDLVRSISVIVVLVAAFFASWLAWEQFVFVHNVERALSCVGRERSWIRENVIRTSPDVECLPQSIVGGNSLGIDFWFEEWKSPFGECLIIVYQAGDDGNLVCSFAERIKSGWDID